MRVVGAGVGRTGTHSLKLALEQLLGAPCYHMIEVFAHPEHVPSWQAAVDGRLERWDAIFAGYEATVDWPSGSFWLELSRAYPDAIVLLSTRDADSWWTSASNTIFHSIGQPPADPHLQPWYEFMMQLLRERFTTDVSDEAVAKAAYLRHNDEVRERVPAGRLLEWHPGDGWEPICERLGVPVPDVPFPHVNTTDEFREMQGLPALP